MRYKDFPKHDLRRCLAVLFAIETLGVRASAHYVSLALECTRAEVMRAIETAANQLCVAVVKIGSVYRIDSWGMLDRDMALARLQRRGTDDQQVRERPKMSARQKEADLLDSLVDAARAGRQPASNAEADLFRFAAQLIKTNHPVAAHALGSAAERYFTDRRVKPRPFPQVVADGLVTDVPRLRRAIEQRLEGVRTW